MARRKKYVDDGYSSDSASSSSSSTTPGQKRKRSSNKESAIYGIFGSGSEGENERQGGVGRTVQAKDRKGRRVDYLKGQSFVAAGSLNDLAKDEFEEAASEGKSSSSGSRSSDEEKDEEDDDFALAKEGEDQSATRTEDLETRNPFVSGPTQEALAEQQQNQANEFRPASFVSSRGGIGSSVVPTSFGSTAPSNTFLQHKTSNLGTKRPTSFVTPSTSIKFGGKFDPSKYLAQMGWTGGGLGREGEGMINPIEVKQRPERAGIAFGGIKEKTKQAKEEAKRRGEEVSTDEDERDKRKKGSRPEQKTRARVEKVAKAWTQPEKKPRKPKVEHRTYEQILENHGQSAATQAGVGQIIDAAGNEFSSISAALAKHSVPTNESTQLVEIRHNLRIICVGNETALKSLAREGANIQEKNKWLLRDQQESQRRILREQQELRRLKGVLDLVSQIEKLGRESLADESLDLASFDGLVRQILVNYRDAIGEFHLDEAIVGAIVPTLRRRWIRWEPLIDPSRAVDHLSRWKDALRVDFSSDIMTPYESLLWNLWMPPIRSALNNAWNVYDSSAAVSLYQTWKPLLPLFIADNLSQQLVIPKLSQAVADWDTKAPLHRAIFPWLALLGEQADGVMAEAKRRLRSSLKIWKVSTGVPVDLMKWKEAKVFSSKEWNSMLLDHVIPKLSSYLDAHLVINPQAQDTRPLETLLAWRPLLANKILSKVLFAKFVPKWVHVLHSWLVDSHANLEEVAQWYEHWRECFVKYQILEIESIQGALRVALQLMSQAIEMGSKKAQLPAPNLRAIQSSSSSSTSQAAKISTASHPAKKSYSSLEDMAASSSSSFRTIVEEAMMEADLIMQSLAQKERRSGMPLYRVSRHLDGKGGVTIYLEEDVVFAERRGEDSAATYEPVSITELVKEVAR
ncbi:hypothetical protein CBS101457_006394 [Exobasidium rhododendri]|nr:hypothetical protein CBS101457_006394 [Exobasidium rhododendri]